MVHDPAYAKRRPHLQVRYQQQGMGHQRRGEESVRQARQFQQLCQHMTQT